VGDEAACRVAFAALQTRMAELLAAEAQEALQEPAPPPAAAAGAAANNPWQPLVFRFRALRESLTSEGVGGALALRAYEASAEACLRAGDVGEYLKCQQRLTTQLYPGATRGDGNATATRLGDGNATARWPEFCACAALYFACVVSASDGGAAELTAQLRATPAALLRTPPVACALRALAALAARDGAAFVAAAAHEDATPLMRLLMARRLPDARRAALSAAARAFRTLPVAAAARTLRLPEEQVAAALAAAAATPGAPAQLAAAARAYAAGGADGAPPRELSFIVAAAAA
jgi:hypothetical protein